MHVQWKNLEYSAQLAEIESHSNEKPVAIFKHSTRCGISSMAMESLKVGWAWTESDLDFYFLDLIKHRDISNDIANRFGVIHQSPQLLLIKSGQVEDKTSHHAIGPEVIDTWLKKMHV